MSLDLKPYTELALADVTQISATITQLTQEQEPTLDLRFGVLQSLVLYVSALHHGSINDLIEQYRRSSSIKMINEDPSLATDEIVDLVLSNRNITRREGTQASGTATIVVSELSPVTVARGTSFAANGQTFVSIASYAAKISSENLLDSTDRVLTPYGGDNYSFTIEVEAVEAGSAGMLVKDTVLVPSTLIANFVKAFATSDFSGGTDRETNTQLMAREAEGMSAQTLSNRSTMGALLTAQFPEVIAKSLIGFGDAEMLRDQHSLWPMSGGGRADWYVRTRELPQKLGLQVSAALVEKTSDGLGIWQISFDRNVAPGFYDVLSILPASDEVSDSGFEMTLNLRQYDLTALADELLPDIAVVAEAVYSRFQTATIRFKDTLTLTDSLSLGATQAYRVTVRILPDLAAIQSYMASRLVRFYGGDLLVKAAIPCFCSIAFTLSGRPGAVLPDPEDVRQAVAKHVNTSGFSGRLHASEVYDVVHEFLTPDVKLNGIDMLGQIVRPDGTVKTLRSADMLVVPDESDSMVSPRTVCFYLYPEDVRISAQTVNIPDVF